MKPLELIFGVIGVLLGGLWLLQRLGILHVRPILCFADCDPIQGPSVTRAITGFLSRGRGRRSHLRAEALFRPGRG